MANRLAQETSPYLLQHADNPVDWYPWGPEAFEKARREDKPILLSVGYSSCHWCHVMERESFQDPDIARVMNENFVCIKVDREERPDVDAVYMTAVQAMTGQGGWPMTVFLTPDGAPFYGGTYFPPEDRHGMTAFPKVLLAIARVYREQRGQVLANTQKLVEQMRRIAASRPPSAEPLTEAILDQAYRGLAASFDHRHGGIGRAPKFPQPCTYEFLLSYYDRTGEPLALHMVTRTLEAMAHGGIYDQLGGGFHRYSTDEIWLVPHFEKMLYDNALLARLFLQAWRVTGRPLFKRVVVETLDYLLREMSGPGGGLYSAQDADSEGAEGKYYLWTPDEVLEALGQEDGHLALRYFGVTPQGDLEGRNVLHIAIPHERLAEELGLASEELEGRLADIRQRLLEARKRRVPPDTDDKIVAAWNGLAMVALAEAGAALDRLDYLEAARQAARFLLDEMMQDGRLMRTYRAGQAKVKGYLEDYACLIDGLIALHGASLEGTWLRRAVELARDMVDLFWNPTQQLFFDTGEDQEELIVRPREVTDGATPSGSSAAAHALLRLAVVTGEEDFRRVASSALRSAQTLMERFPHGAGRWLCALDFYLSPTVEVAIVGPPRRPDTVALAREVWGRFMANGVLVGWDGQDLWMAGLPLLEGREALDGKATAYVCQDYVCDLPVTEPQDLARLLAERSRSPGSRSA